MHPFIQVALGVFIADFVIALFHWIEDVYFSYCMNIPIISSIAKANEFHHYFPRDIVVSSYLDNVSVTLPLSICIIIIIIAISSSFVYNYKYMFLTIFIMTSVANIFHRFTHMRDCECPSIILALHKTGILVGHPHHKQHHENPNQKYGVIFPFTNYIYDSIGLWRALEAIIFISTGIKTTGKLPYTDYVDEIQYTAHHENAGNSCPSRITQEQLEDLKNILNNYYKCK